LPRPRILAIIFMVIAPMAGLDGGRSGNKIPKGPLILLDKALTRPDFSATFIRPSHKEYIPIRAKHNSTADLAPSKAA